MLRKKLEQSPLTQTQGDSLRLTHRVFLFLERLVVELVNFETHRGYRVVPLLVEPFSRGWLVPPEHIVLTRDKTRAVALHVTARFTRSKQELSSAVKHCVVRLPRQV